MMKNARRGFMGLEPRHNWMERLAGLLPDLRNAGLSSRVWLMPAMVIAMIAMAGVNSVEGAAIHILKNDGTIAAYETDGTPRPTVFTDDTVDVKYVGIANYRGEFLLLANDGNVDDLHPELGYRSNPFTDLQGFVGYKGIAYDPSANVVLMLNGASLVEVYDEHGVAVPNHPFHGVQLPPLSVVDISYDSVNNILVAGHTDGSFKGYNSLGGVVVTDLDNLHTFVSLGGTFSGAALIFDPFDLFKGGEWPYEVRPVNLLNQAAAGASGAGASGVPNLINFNVPKGNNRALLVVAVFERDHLRPFTAADFDLDNDGLIDGDLDLDGVDDDGYPENDYNKDGLITGGNFAAPNFYAGDYTINARFTGPGGVVNTRNPMAFPDGDLRFTWQYLFEGGSPTGKDGAKFSGETYHLAIYESQITALLNGAESGNISIALSDVQLPKSAGDDAIISAYVFDNVEQSTRGITRSGVNVDTYLGGGVEGNWVRSDNDLDSLQEPDEPYDGFLAVGFNFQSRPLQETFIPQPDKSWVLSGHTTNPNGLYNAFNDPDGISIGAEYRNGPTSGLLDSFTMAANGDSQEKTNGGAILGFTIEAIGAGSREETDPFERTRIPVDARTYLFQTNKADIWTIDLLTGESWLLVDDSWNGEVNAVGFNIIDGSLWGYPRSNPGSHLVRYDGNFKGQLIPIVNLPVDDYFVGDINSSGIMILKHNRKQEAQMIDLNPNSPTYLNWIGQINTGFTGADWSFSPKDGKLYSVSAAPNFELIRVDPLAGSQIILGIIAPMIRDELVGGNGATFFDSDGHFYVSNNSSGNIYKILSPHSYVPGGEIHSSLFTYGPKSANNDGARAPTPITEQFNANPVRQVNPPLTISVSSTIRDVHIDHPNFEPSSDMGLVKGVVAPTIGPDKKPVWAGDTIAPFYDGFSTKVDFDTWWNDTLGITKSIPPADIIGGDAPGAKITLHKNPDGTYTFEDYDFFPLHVNSVNPGVTLPSEQDNNNYFTMELHTSFVYQKGSVMEFDADDDLWVFIDNRLAVDIGGIHASSPALLNLDDLGLREGGQYSFDLFYAERRFSGARLVMRVPYGFGMTSSQFFANTEKPEDCCLGVVSMEDFSTAGGAEFIPATENFLLASGEVGQESGAVWKKDKIDLTQDFLLSTDLYLGESDSGIGGVTITIQDSLGGSAAVGSGVSSLGTVPTSFGVYFKTYSEGLDPLEDHLSFYENGVISPTGGGAIPINVNGSNVENGRWVPVDMVWDASKQVMEVYVDGLLTQTITKDIINESLGGSPTGYLGFTAATDPLNPNRYGARLRELVVTEDSLPQLQLSVANELISPFKTEGVLLDPNLEILTDTPGAIIDGATARFAGGYDSATECLIVTEAVPAPTTFTGAVSTVPVRTGGGFPVSGTTEGISWNFNASTGVLTLMGEAPVETYQSVLRRVAYVHSNFIFAPATTHKINISLGAAPSLNVSAVDEQPHFYQLFSRTIPLSWPEAEALAESKSYLGHRGYLMTISSVQENNLISSLFDFDKAWMGANDVAYDHSWRWVTGPEGIEEGRDGRFFFQQMGAPETNHLQGAIGGSPINSRFNNWASNQPDSFATNQPEDFGYIDLNGQWADTDIKGESSIYHYIVEYGGMPGDPSSSDLFAQLNLVLQIVDQDFDGVVDDEDVCSDTPPGTLVDFEGCPLPTITVQNAMGIMETAIPLNITVDAANGVDTIRIFGLPDGSTLSHGFETRTGFWVVPIADVPNLAVVPAPGFKGTVTLEIGIPSKNMFKAAKNGDFGRQKNPSIWYPSYAKAQDFDASTPFTFVEDATYDNQYTVTNWTNWRTRMYDRTEPLNGYFGVFDLDVPGLLLEATVNKLAPGQRYEVMFWMANMNSKAQTAAAPISLEAGFVRENGFIPEYNTARIPGYKPLTWNWRDRWEAHAFHTVADNSGTMHFQLINRSPASTVGNDVCIDDISIRQLIVQSMELNVLGQEIQAAGSTGWNTSLLPVNVDLSDITSNRPFLVSGVPAGAELNYGSEISPGVWIVSPSRIQDLAVLVARGYHGTFNLEVIQIGHNESITGRDHGQFNGLEIGAVANHNINRNLTDRSPEDDFGPDGTPIKVTYPELNPDIVTTVIADAVEAIYELHQAAHLTYVNQKSHLFSHDAQNIWGYSGLVTFNTGLTEIELMDLVNEAKSNIEAQLDLFLLTSITSPNISLPPEWPLQVPVISSDFWTPENGVPASGVTILSGPEYSESDEGSALARRLAGDVTITHMAESVAVDAATDYVVTITVRNSGATALVGMSLVMDGVEIISTPAIVNDGTWQVYIANWNSGALTSVPVTLTTTGPLGHDTTLEIGEVDISAEVFAMAAMEAIPADAIAPVAVSTVIETDGVNPDSVDVVSLSYDNEGLIDPTSVTIVTAPSTGSVSVDPVTGVITYTPTSGLVDDEFTYHLSDMVGNVSNIAKIIVAAAVVAPAPDDLIGYWNFNELTGQVAKDHSNYKNDGQLKNYPDATTHWVGGQLGNALSFGGPATEQFVLVPEYPAVTTELSIGVWVWMASYQNYGTIIKNWGEGLTGQFHFDLGPNGDSPTVTVGQPDSTPPLEPVNYNPGENPGGVKLGGVRTNPGKGGSVVETVSPVPLSTWQHFAMVADGTNVILYLNGVEVASTPYNGEFNASEINALGIGAKLDDFGTGAAFETPGYFEGRMDDLAMWNRALSPTEVSDLYTNGLAGQAVLGTVSDAVAPQIITSPAPVTVSVGETAVLSAEFSGSSPMVVQWFRNGSPLEGENGNTLIILNAAESDIGNYHVQLTNQAGVAISNSARLDVIDLSSLDTSLTAYWRFDEGDGPLSVDDANNGYDVDLMSVSGNSLWTTGILGNALNLHGDAAGDYAMVSEWNQATSALTVSAWVKADTETANGSIIRNYGDTEAVGWFSLGFSGTTRRIANTAHFNEGEFTIASDTDLEIGQWNHIALVISESTHKIYQNGVLVAQGPGATLSSLPHGFIGIGARPDDFGNLSSVFPQIWDGQIDDVAVWLRDLSSLEVKTLNSEGRKGDSLGELIGRIPAHIVRHPQSVQTVKSLPLELSVEAIGPNISYQWFKDGNPLPSQISSTLKIDEVDTVDAGNYQVMVSNIAGRKFSQVAVVEIYSGSTLGSGLVGYWPFDETSGQVAHDYSSARNNGQLIGYSGEMSQWASGQVGGALDFGGVATGEYVLVPAYPKPTTSYTISAWVKPRVLDYDATIIKNWGDGTLIPGTSGRGQFQLGLASTSGEVTGVVIESSGSGNTLSVRDTGSPLVVGKWVHVMLVHDGTSLTLFKNGEAVSTVSSTYIHNNSNLDALGIGVRLNDTEDGPGWDMAFWNGLMDEVTIWNRNLTDEELAAVYQLGASMTGLSKVVTGLAPQSLIESGDFVGTPLAESSANQAGPELKVGESPNGLLLQWTSGYVLETSGSLTDGNWKHLSDGEESQVQEGQLQHILSHEDLGKNQMFFRIVRKNQAPSVQE